VSNISSAENNNFGTLIANMDLERVDFKRNVVLQNISFESATATLRESSYRELDKVVTLLKNNPNIKLEIGAHTDSRGSDASNLKLSKERAQAALNYVLIAAKGSISPELVRKVMAKVNC
jgi:outer membrane protein OmpA-like peptidoglycan-associated protein